MPDNNQPINEQPTPRPPGVCIPWSQKLPELPPITANPAVVQKVWEDTDALAYTYIWQILLSF
jgi:hypothetical protein